MVIRKVEAQEFVIPGGTKGTLYPSKPQDAFSIAQVEIDGRYPAEGYSYNDRCTETIIVLEGAFTFYCGGQRGTIEVGDVMSVAAPERYMLEGKGRAGVFITPGWDSAQNHIVQEEA